MPNLSPRDVRKKYELYDNKICTGEEAAECRGCLARRMESIGYRVVVDRGDARQPALSRIKPVCANYGDGTRGGDQEYHQPI